MPAHTQQLPKAVRAPKTTRAEGETETAETRPESRAERQDKIDK